MHVYTDWTSVYTLIRRSFGGMEFEPMLTPREKSPLPENVPRRAHNLYYSSWMTAVALRAV